MIITEEIKNMTFKIVGDLATNGDESARLYWMALARLTSMVDEYKVKTPDEVHEIIMKLVKEIYEDNPIFGVSETIERKIEKFLLGSTNEGIKDTVKKIFGKKPKDKDKKKIGRREHTAKDLADFHDRYVRIGGK
jgi:hypothetical protein